MDGDRGSSPNDGEPLYCSNCGAGLEHSMNYCPSCGAPNGTAERSRTRSSGSARGRVGQSSHSGSSTETADRDVLEYRIATAAQDGWELEHDFGDHAVMVRRTFGSVNDHLIVAVLTVWFTMGIGNALYGVYRYFGDAERIVLRADHAEAGSDADETSESGLLAKATAGVCWLATAIVAAIGIQFGAATPFGVVFLALAVAFAALGVSVLPSVSRRLENRHSVTANGRVRSVDERTVVDYNRPCAACAEPVGRGLERTYRKEFCVLGVPLTASAGRNSYCRGCANGTHSGGHEGATTGPAASTPASNHPVESDSDMERESA